MDIEKLVIDSMKLIGVPNNITLVLADRTAVEPPAPYILINVMTTVNTAMPNIDIIHKDGVPYEYIRQPKNTVIAFTIHAKATDTAQDWFEFFHSGLCSNRYTWAFESHGIGLQYADNIQYMAQPIDGVAYQRAMFNLTLSYIKTYEHAVNKFNSIEASGELTDSLNNNTTIDIDVNNT